MIVHVVTGNIQQDGNIGPEIMDPLQLETADFNDHIVVLLRPVDITDQRRSDIPAHKYRFSRFRQDFPDQGRRGRFPVGPGNGNHRPLQKTAGQFQFTQNRLASVHRFQTASG